MWPPMASYARGRRCKLSLLAAPGFISTAAVGLRLTQDRQEEQQQQLHGDPEQQELDFSALSEAGEFGSAVADLHEALRAYQDGDYKLVCLRMIRVAANLAGMESEAEFLAAIEDGGELRDLLRSEQYLSLLAKLVKLIPHTGDPEIDIPLGVLQSLELVRLRQSWESAVAGEYNRAVKELGAAVLPRSFEEAFRNTRPQTVAPVAVGLVAGYYGYMGRFGRGARSNFLLGSFACTAAIRLGRLYRTGLAAAKADGRLGSLYSGCCEECLMMT